MAPGWPEAKIWTQCAWHDHGEQIDSKGPRFWGTILMSFTKEMGKPFCIVFCFFFARQKIMSIGCRQLQQ